MIPPGHVPGSRAPVAEGELSHKQRLLAGQPYDACDPELTDDRIRARKLMHQFNTALPYDDVEGRAAVLKELLGSFDPGRLPWGACPVYLPVCRGGGRAPGSNVSCLSPLLQSIHLSSSRHSIAISGGVTVCSVGNAAVLSGGALRATRLSGAHCSPLPSLICIAATTSIWASASTAISTVSVRCECLLDFDRKKLLPVRACLLPAVRRAPACLSA